MYLGHLFNYTENVSQVFPTTQSSLAFSISSIKHLQPWLSSGTRLSSALARCLRFQLTQCHLLPVPVHRTASRPPQLPQPQRSRTQAGQASAVAMAPTTGILSRAVLGSNRLQADGFTLLKAAHSKVWCEKD